MVFKWTLDAAGTLIHPGFAALCQKLVPFPPNSTSWSVKVLFSAKKAIRFLVLVSVTLTVPIWAQAKVAVRQIKRVNPVYTKC